MTIRIKLSNNIKKGFYAALLAGGITLVGCNVKTEANNSADYSIEQSTIKYDPFVEVIHNADGTETVNYYAQHGGVIVNENGKMVEVVMVNPVDKKAPEETPIEVKKKEFTEADYIKSLADKVSNYNVDAIIDNKIYSNFLYNPNDKEAFYGVREQYGNRIATLTDSNIATPLSEDAINKLNEYLDNSIINYTNDCEYVKLHQDELKDIYDNFKDFDFFRVGNYNNLHELDKYVGIYNTNDYSIRATQYAIEIINPSEGSIITIYPEKNPGNIGAAINDRTIYNNFGEEYCEALINSGMPELSKDALMSHGCHFELMQ